MIHDLRESFGRSFEDFHVGDVFRHWPGKTIFESDNNLFSLLTMNHHPVHLDAAYAAAQHHGQILVVGPLVISVVVGLTVSAISGRAIANLEYSSITHDGPVFVGDTVYAETEVLDAVRSTSNPMRGIVRVETRAHNQHGARVLTLQRRVLVPARST